MYLYHRHSALERTTTEDARSETDIEQTTCKYVGHGGNESRRVLIIGMHHDYNVSAEIQSFSVAHLLICTVSEVLTVTSHMETK